MPKRKSEEISKKRLFTKKNDAYIKPSIMDRTLGVASEVWVEVARLDIAGRKKVKKWTIMERESFFLGL